MYNLLEYSKNYKKTTGNTYDVGSGIAGYDANKFGRNETEVVIPLKYLSNFWRTLNIPLINCEILRIDFNLV